MLFLTLIRALSRRRRFSLDSKRNTRVLESMVPERYVYIIYITLSCAVEALDEAGAFTFGSPDFFWEVDVHHKRTSATFYERAPPVNIPPRSISAVRYTNWTKIANLGIADLGVLEA